MKLKRFLIFAYSDYYPEGGWNDYRGSFDTLEEVQEFLEREDIYSFDNKCVVDTETGETYPG